MRTGKATRTPRSPVAGLRSRLPPRAWIFVAPVLVLLAYLPLVFIEYGFSEDFRLMAAYDRGGGLQRLMIAEGRPGFALWVHLFFSGLGDIGSLRYIRLLNIAMIAILAAVLTLAWRRAGWRRAEATAAGVIAMTLPSYQLFAATAAMGATIVAALCGAGAAFLALDAAAVEDPQRSAKRHIAASLLLLLGLATYQSAGLIYFAFAGIFLIAAKPAGPEFARRVRTFALVAGPAFLAEFLIFLAGRAAFGSHLLGAPRGDLVFAPLEKLAWFVFYPMPHALNLWKLHPDLLLALAMMIVLPAGIMLYLRPTTGRTWRGLVALALLPLCYVPNLVVAENRSSFRSLPALGVLVLVWYLIVLRGQFGSSRAALHRLLLAGLVVTGLACAAVRPIRLIAAPQARELALVRETLSLMPPSYRRIGVIPANFRDALAPFVMYDEFGYPSTALPWSTYEITYLVLRELHPDADTSAIRALPVDLFAERPDTVIDWGTVLRSDNTAAHDLR